MRKYAKTFVLLFVLAALIGGFLLLKNANLFDKHIYIYNNGEGSVKKIDIKSDKGTVSMKEDVDKWIMLEPKDYKLDPDMVFMLVRRLESFEALRIIEEEPSDLSRYGLDKPVMTVDITLRNGKVKTLLLGTEAASKSQFYVKDSETKPVYTISISDWGAFKDGEAGGFRDRRILTVNTGEINIVEFDVGTKQEFKMELIEGSKGKWQLAEPVIVKTKEDAVSDVLKKVIGLRVKDFVKDGPESLEPYGLNKPLYTFVVSDKSGKTQKIFFGKEKEPGKSVYIKADGVNEVFTVASEELNLDKLKIGEIINEAPLSVSIDMVDKIVIDDNGKTTEFVRDTAMRGDVFRYNGKKVQFDDLTALFVNLMALSSEGYDPGNKGGNPDLIVYLQLKEKSGMTKVEFAKRDDNTYFMAVDGKQLPFYVAARKVELVRRWVDRVIGKKAVGM